MFEWHFAMHHMDCQFRYLSWLARRSNWDSPWNYSTRILPSSVIFSPNSCSHFLHGYLWLVLKLQLVLDMRPFLKNFVLQVRACWSWKETPFLDWTSAWSCWVAEVARTRETTGVLWSCKEDRRLEECIKGSWYCNCCRSRLFFAGKLFTLFIYPAFWMQI